eukprot:gnl/TRDRNA2_/TRDRNA2_173653_c10_seq4.p1 gnl/TRDRNA2_/TRDRNA2_173653_c10~~gnl/TRDRNA2_/TRDRNA2_173653_c10_seq4.p1  ORF type:complete len:296 (-),score=60.17 gnl/TRDRNA2_/TRDRNA2_173653_c10_seq4:28-786(-)
MAGEHAPAMLDPVSVIDTIEMQGNKAKAIEYRTLMQCVAVTGQIASGFVLVERMEASGLLSSPDDEDDYYSAFRGLLENCRIVGDFAGASRVQAMVERLGLIALPPVAVSLIQGLERQYENGPGGDGAAAAQSLWKQLRQQTAYTSQVQALPWDFVQKTSLAQQERSLQLHAEKKALAEMLNCGESELTVSINFYACMDCHEFFKSASLLLGRDIELRQPKLVHTFKEGRCSCKDRWRWEARLAPTSRLAPP